jgi:hypothetical protein
LQKYFASPIGRSSFIDSTVHPTKGRIAIVTDAGLDAMDAGGATDEGAICGRRSRVVLTSSNFFGRQRSKKTSKNQVLSGYAPTKKTAGPNEAGPNRP